jgi:hypothetical protein
MKKKLFRALSLALPLLGGCVLFLPKTPEGVSAVCASTTYGQATRIIEKMYPDFKSRGVEHAVWFDRRDIEAARYAMTGGRKGIPATDTPVCAPGDRAAPGFKLVKFKYRRARRLVEKMEAAEGVKYIKWDKNEKRMLFKDASGRILSNDEANGL